MAKYEYKFIVLGRRLFKDPDYEKAIRDHAEEGWRLVQIFNIGTGGIISPELHIIFERKI